MIGILTFFDCFNYGTFLQAYALQNYLLKKGYENEFIYYRNHENSNNEYATVLDRDSKGDPVLYGRILKKIAVFKSYHKLLRKTKRYYTREELAALHYDIIIVGSDQIWCYSKEWSGVDTPFFSDYLNAKKIIAYAASMGPDKCSQQHPRIIKRLMKNFRHVGVRDTNTFQFAKELNDHPPRMVLDPTHLYDFSKECREVHLKDYILFYSDGLVPPPEVIEELKRLSREHKLKIISIGMKFDWCDRSVITPSPFRFMGYVKGARFVVTCMFHGLMFSVKFKRQFAMFLIPERENKCLDFLNQVGLSGRVIRDAGMVQPLFDTPIDYAPVDRYLEEQKKISEEFLLSALEND